ncbi:hypothetical protein [Arcobacter sp. F2176]|uniref:hypothetical protein n=1 Tax=Arcobacter sp. F2176 TaxID=2044511 RepID=UPI0013E92D02|nr:hypothetical protein [Arcobacter sp. F2176]
MAIGFSFNINDDSFAFNKILVVTSSIIAIFWFYFSITDRKSFKFSFSNRKFNYIKLFTILFFSHIISFLVNYFYPEFIINNIVDNQENILNMIYIISDSLLLKLIVVPFILFIGLKNTIYYFLLSLL